MSWVPTLRVIGMFFSLLSAQVDSVQPRPVVAPATRGRRRTSHDLGHSSNEQVGDDFAGGDDSVGTLELVVDVCGRFDTQGCVNRGDDVAGDQWMTGGKRTRAVARTVDQPRLETSAD